MATLTAYQTPYLIAQLKPRQWLTINSCSAGVEVVVTQIAAALVASVIGICSTKNHKLAHEIGDIETIDYTQQTTLNF